MPVLITKLRYAVLPLVAVALLAGCAKPDLKAEAQKAIQAGYDTEDAAMKRNDPAGLFAYHSPDCVFIDRKGKASPGGLREEIESIRPIFTIPETTWERTTKINDLALNNAQGTEAIVNVTHVGVATRRKTDSQQLGTLTITTLNRDFWVKSPQGWRIKRSKYIKGKTKTDINPPGSLK